MGPQFHFKRLSPGSTCVLSPGSRLDVFVYFIMTLLTFLFTYWISSRCFFFLRKYKFSYSLLCILRHFSHFSQFSVDYPDDCLLLTPFFWTNKFFLTIIVFISQRSAFQPATFGWSILWEGSTYGWIKRSCLWWGTRRSISQVQIKLLNFLSVDLSEVCFFLNYLVLFENWLKLIWKILWHIF